MNRAQRIAERSIALALLAAIAFAPPLLAIFSGRGLLFGFLPLFLYLFIAWGIVIALVALVARGAADEDGHAVQRGRPVEPR